LCCLALLAACGNHSGEAERSYWIGPKLFGFIPEPAFTFIPESCSRSSRNAVRNHPGIAFICPGFPTDHTSSANRKLGEVRAVQRQIAYRFGLPVRSGHRSTREEPPPQ